MINSVKSFLGIQSAQDTAAKTTAAGQAHNGAIVISSGAGLPSPMSVFQGTATPIIGDSGFGTLTTDIRSPLLFAGGTVLDSQRGDEIANLDMLATYIAAASKFTVLNMAVSNSVVNNGSCILDPLTNPALTSKPEVHIFTIMSLSTCKVLDQETSLGTINSLYYNDAGQLRNQGAVNVMATSNTLIGFHMVGAQEGGTFQSETGVISAGWRGNPLVLPYEMQFTNWVGNWNHRCILLPTKNPTNRAIHQSALAYQLAEMQRVAMALAKKG